MTSATRSSALRRRGTSVRNRRHRRDDRTSPTPRAADGGVSTSTMIVSIIGRIEASRHPIVQRARLRMRPRSVVDVFLVRAHSKSPVPWLLAVGPRRRRDGYRGRRPGRRRDAEFQACRYSGSTSTSTQVSAKALPTAPPRRRSVSAPGNQSAVRASFGTISFTVIGLTPLPIGSGVHRFNSISSGFFSHHFSAVP